MDRVGDVVPFDTTKQRQPVIILPPTEHDGGPRRIRIEIEIVDRRQQSPRGYRFGSFTFWLLMFLLLAALAHAQPTNWQSYQQGFITRYEGTDANGGQWTGSSYQQGFMTYSEFTGPNGESRHCSSYELSGTRYTDCQ